MLGDRHLCRVLIVEDEGLVAMLLEDMLIELGYEVAGIANRLERAAQCIRELHFDVAILDVNLDGERSYSLASTLKARNIPFLFATGYGTFGLEKEWQDVPTLQKPYQMRTLEEGLRRIVCLGPQPNRQQVD